MTNTVDVEPAASIENRAPNVARLFLDRVEQTPERPAYRFPDGADWTSVTWAETGDRVRDVAAGLVALGVEAGQRVAIASGTRYEWIVADLAIMCAGAATTTVYPSSMASDVAFILADSESRVVFAEDDSQVAKLAEVRSEIPLVTAVVTFEGSGDGDWVLSLDDVAARGRELLSSSPSVIDDRIAAIRPESLATLIYTSGTTGRPKGVRLRHSSWTYEGAAVASEPGLLSVDDLQYLWLPMAHSFGKVLLSTQLAVGFETAVDGRIDKIIENLAIVKPTFMGAAPRIFEKAYNRITTMTANEGGAKKKIFDWAFKVGLEVKAREADGRKIPPLLKVQHGLAKKLVFSKIQERFGGRVRFFISGAAALNGEIARWFDAAGILILEGYGLTETSAGSSVNRPTKNKFGTIGIPFEGTEFRVAEDGELLIKGPGVMDGYHNLDEATAETLDSEGWLHTGDIAEMDSDGFTKITDRKKDLFKTSGGKYVAPSQIESQFKAMCPYVGQVVVHGNQRNFVVALVTLDPEAISGWASSQSGLGSASYDEIVASDQARSMVDGYVTELNAKLNRWETVKKFLILDHDLSVESGEMTPSLKVKRKVVEDNHRAQLDELYA
ncbi:MAG: long-chain fatty acid--CoA ligase [Geodermatophilaceae bacterium]|nr:long-chain fatty acid--CoA ligase [Geodermatophilaceae bacterium]